MPVDEPQAGRPWRKWLLLGCLLPALCGTGSVVALLLWVFNEPPSIEAVVHAPPPAQVGAEVRIDVDIRNDDSDPHTLSAIVLDDAYLAGVTLHRTEPPFTGSQHGRASPIQMYDLALVVPSGDTRRLTLVASGRSAGQFSSELALMFDGGASHLTRHITTGVLEEGSSP